jgi:hypothetical protein
VDLGMMVLFVANLLPTEEGVDILGVLAMVLMIGVCFDVVKDIMEMEIV